MGLKFKNQSRRAQWWDYSSSATYFITICTQDRTPYFGYVLEGEMNHSQIGSIVEEEWLKSIELRPQMKIELHNFVVMPDHFHGLITIGTSEFQGQNTFIDKSNELKLNRFKPQSNNLASLVRGFKSSVTCRCRVLGLEFQWQSRYYDVIVRDPKQFDIIQKYILDNPEKYKKSNV